MKIQFLSQGVYYIDGATLNPENYECPETTQVARVRGELGFHLFPNPTSDYLIIEAPTNFENYRFEISSHSGGLINNSKQDNASRIPLHGLEPGLYFITLRTSADGQLIETFRVIKR